MHDLMKKYFVFCLWTLFSVSFFACNTRDEKGDKTKRDKPNVIVIYADDLVYEDLSCYWATEIETPHIDRLASERLRFTDAHCTASTCTPSRYSILTGEYAFRSKGAHILPGNAALLIPQDQATLGTVFQEAGYKT